MRKSWSFLERAVLGASAMLVGTLAMAQSGTGSSAAPQPSVRSFAPPPGALIAPGETPDLALLYTGNVIGYLEPCG